jgi:hypothetical protein
MGPQKKSGHRKMAGNILGRAMSEGCFLRSCHGLLPVRSVGLRAGPMPPRPDCRNDNSPKGMPPFGLTT